MQVRGVGSSPSNRKSSFSLEFYIERFEFVLRLPFGLTPYSWITQIKHCVLSPMFNMDASKIGFFIHFVDQYEGLKNNRLNL